jgi:hypothetical protein
VVPEPELGTISALGDPSAVVHEVEGGYALYAELDSPAEPCKRVEIFGYNLSPGEYSELTSNL